MAYDEQLAERLRAVFDGQEGVIEKRMFGGLAFMVNGNMCCGINGTELMVRVGPDQYEESLVHPHARPMDFTGKPMRGMVYVATEGIASDDGLSEWVGRGLVFVSTLPPK
jgi:TfoX/Sxy family transcriptional regulator of competence genes